MNDDEQFLENGKRYVANAVDLDKALRDLVRVAAEMTGSNMGALYLVDDSGGVLKPATLVNLPQEFVESCGEIPVGQQCCGRAVLHKLPWYVADIWNDPLFPQSARDGARRAGIRAGMSVPVLTCNDACIGALSTHFPQAHVPCQDELRRHALFAQLIAYALTRRAESRINTERVPPAAADQQNELTGT